MTDYLCWPSGIARHLQGNEATTKVVIEHVLLPMLGCQKAGEEKMVEAKPLAQKKGTVV